MQVQCVSECVRCICANYLDVRECIRMYVCVCVHVFFQQDYRQQHMLCLFFCSLWLESNITECSARMRVNRYTSNISCSCKSNKQDSTTVPLKDPFGRFVFVCAVFFDPTLIELSNPKRNLMHLSYYCVCLKCVFFFLLCL